MGKANLCSLEKYHLLLIVRQVKVWGLASWLVGRSRRLREM